uniref:Nucleic acid binding protein n=1 Tax=Garlic virus D TaxID=12430 RepID=A0A249RNZ3_9VIRU|nr:nucleic acid binding protein [Garlic virus D]
MHPHDFNLLCCLHFSQPPLPKDLKEFLFARCVDYCKLVRKINQNKPFQGISKCAKRRRAKRYSGMLDFGAFLVDEHRCKVFVSRAHSDVLAVIHEGPVKLSAERFYRPNSDAAQLTEHDILYIKALKL